MRMKYTFTGLVLSAVACQTGAWNDDDDLDTRASLPLCQAAAGHSGDGLGAVTRRPSHVCAFVPPQVM